jgi:fucose permease
MPGEERSTFARRSPGADRSSSPGWSARRTLIVLHPAFALTGISHSIGGPLLPSLAPEFHLDDSQAGFLLFAYFAGTSVGALFCGRRHARTLFLGFLALSVAGIAVAATDRMFLYPAFLFFGISVGVPMTAVSMLTGRTFGAGSAAPLTFLNFSWSAGALLAPLLAARLLVHHTFRAAYVLLAAVGLLAAVACSLQLEDAPQSTPSAPPTLRMVNVRFIALFAFLTFLEVGVENTSASWLTTYVLRTAGNGAAWAAAATSLYWCGFLASRGLSSLLLLRVEPGRVLRIAVFVGIVAGTALLAAPGTVAHVITMVILGASLAPVFPLMMARFFAQASDSSDSRWVLAVCGFGGSVLPWIAGLLSAHTGSLRLGLVVIPAALVVIVCTLPLIRAQRTVPGEPRIMGE